MTKCNISILVFQDPKSRKIEFNFSGGDISSGGGLLLVKEFDRKLLDSFDIRRPGKVEHSYQACFVNEFLGWLPAMKISMLIMNCEMIR